MKTLLKVLLNLKHVTALPCEIFGNFLTDSGQWSRFLCQAVVSVVSGITLHSASICLTCAGSDGGVAGVQPAESKPLSSSAQQSSVGGPTSSHFMSYFITVTVVVVMIYVVYHKRNLVTRC